MIKAYLVGVESPYEGEDIQIEFYIYEENKLVNSNKVYMDYVKPVLVNQYGLDRLLIDLREYKEDEIEIYINDTLLFQALNNKLATKHGDLLRLNKKTQSTLMKYTNTKIINVATNKELYNQWLKIIKTK